MKPSLFIGAILSVAALTACSRGESKIDVAHAILHAQVADDIAIKLRGSRLNNTADRFYYVCGTANMNRPNAGELTLDNVDQRFIITVNREQRIGGALFDGDTSPEGLDRFQQEWLAKCPA